MAEAPKKGPTPTKGRKGKAKPAPTTQPTTTQATKPASAPAK